MAKRVKLVSPNGGTEIEINEGDTAYLVEKGWKLAGSKKPATIRTSNKGD
jgi:hypothetical protein